METELNPGITAHSDFARSPNVVFDLSALSSIHLSPQMKLASPRGVSRPQSNARSEPVGPTRQDQLRGWQISADVATRAAAIFAHELAQPISAVINYVEACQRTLAPFRGQIPDTVFDCLEKATRETVRSGQVIGHLRRLLESKTGERTEVNITDVIERACARLSSQIKDGGIELTLELDHSLPPVLVDPILLELVVINLVRNSIEALVESPRKHVTVTSAVESDQSILVTVTDSGPGLPPNVAKRPFHPVESEKLHGMGVGLSICDAAVAAHGGLMSGHSAPDEPTVFSFRLPPELIADG